MTDSYRQCQTVTYYETDHARLSGAISDIKLHMDKDSYGQLRIVTYSYIWEQIVTDSYYLSENSFLSRL